MNVTCNLCGATARLVNTVELVGVDTGEEAWLCVPCNAWVGAYQDGTPRGTLAQAPLRTARARAHRALGPLCRAKMRRDRCTRQQALRRAYDWASDVLGIEREYCCIELFKEELCTLLIAACKNITGPSSSSNVNRPE